MLKRHKLTIDYLNVSRDLKPGSRKNKNLAVYRYLPVIREAVNLFTLRSIFLAVCLLKLSCNSLSSPSFRFVRPAFAALHKADFIRATAFFLLSVVLWVELWVTFLWASVIYDALGWTSPKALNWLWLKVPFPTFHSPPTTYCSDLFM